MACQDRFTALIGGIGSGKTYGGAVKGLVVGAETKGLGLVVAPTYPMLRDATLRTYQDVFGDAITNFYKSEMRADILGGGEILFRSADQPDRLRGPNLHWAHIDEGALCPRQTWEIIIGRLRAEGTAGPCWITTTPKGRNWLYERSSEMTVFKARTADNPYLDAEFIRSLQAVYTGNFARQELEGEFVAYEGIVYEEFSRDVHVVRRDASEFRSYVAGIDEGYTNPAVILVCGLDADGRLHIASEFYKRRVTQDDFVRAAADIHGHGNIGTFYVDPSAAGLIAAMHQAGLPAVRANNAVFDGIQAVKSRLAIAGDGRPRLTIDPSCVYSIAEFESYAWKETRIGMKDEPEKANDHSMDTVRYTVMGIGGAVDFDSVPQDPGRPSPWDIGATREREPFAGSRWVI